MKKQKTRRVLSLLLLLVLTLQLAVVASAAQEVWVGNSGNAFVATVSKFGNATRQIAVTTMKVYHAKGADTSFSSGTHTIEYTQRFGFPTTDVYAYRLTNAATKEGLKETFKVTRYLESNGVYVPRTDSTGYYCATVAVFGYMATYTVQESLSSGMATRFEGEIAFAPYGAGNVAVGYVAAP